jgi:hypothetical protein
MNQRQYVSKRGTEAAPDSKLEVYPVKNTCQEREYASTTRGHRLCVSTAPGAKHKDEHRREPAE